MMVRGLLAAISFLTLIPIPSSWLGTSLVPPRKMLWWWVPIGLLLGLLATLITWGCKLSGLHWITCAAIGVISLAKLTGGIHIDGFMDTWDGLGSRAPRERALEIMKDSRVGAFGAMTLVALLLFKFAVMAGFTPEIGLRTLLLSPVIGRMMQLICLAGFRYARSEGGMGAMFFTEINPWHVLLGIILTTITCFIVSPIALLAMMITVFYSIFVARFIAVRLGGMTGDTIGAVSEQSEIAFFFIVALLT